MIRKEIRTENQQILCTCCKEGYVSGDYDVCLTCGWENDPIQNDDESFSGGANKLSLRQHKEAFDKKRKDDPEYMWCNEWSR